jgi:phosphoribosylglycinamide formyltransferase-1
VLLAGPGDSTRIVYHYLASRFEGLVAIVESPVPRFELAKRRARRFGWVTVAGQMAFVGAAVPVIRRLSLPRIDEIVRSEGFDTSDIDGAKSVQSVNSAESVTMLRELDPAVVVVNGTRIISESVLSSVGCAFVNMHAGITPRYRGVHGGYWALSDQRRDLVGTTVHVVDPGIDTGGVLAQGFFEPGPQDTFATYPYLHLACGLPLLAQSVREIVEGRDPQPVPSRDTSGESTLRFHPTIWGYLGARMTRGVR